MFRSRLCCGVGNVSLLISILAIHFITYVHGLPTDTSNERIAERMRADGIPVAISPTASVPDALAKFPPDLLNQFLRTISTLPAGAAALDAVGETLTPLQQQLADAVYINTTRNDLVQTAPCADVTVVFARGTTEPGNVGLVTGPPFFDALRLLLGSRTLAFQGVEYPATFAGFNLQGAEGVPSMTNLLHQARIKCPKTKVVMSGYSQGALVVRSTINSVPAATLSQISAIITFGDPQKKVTIGGADGKALVICHQNDAVCNGGFINLEHLTYAQNAIQAALFVVLKTLGGWTYDEQCHGSSVRC